MIAEYLLVPDGDAKAKYVEFGRIGRDRNERNRKLVEHRMEPGYFWR